MIRPRDLLGAATAFATSMSVVGIGLFVAFDGLSVANLVRSLGLTGFAGIAATGYGLTLWLGRRHLRTDTRVGGRRDMIAGMLAIVLILAASIITQGAAPALRVALCVVSGALSAVMMYFPWFQRDAHQRDVRVVAADA